MEIVICKTAAEASRKAADRVVKCIKAKPNCVLGLATGSTPLQMYAALADDVKAGKVSFKSVKSWNLDEYCGLAATHEQSYRYFMNVNFFDKIDIDKANTHVLNGLATDWRKECADYEAAIKAAGGVDLQILGLGSDGHIAFNEPGSSLASCTRKVCLTPETIEANARFFATADEVPRYALSMGIGTICEARQIILLAFGAKKARAMKGMVEGAMSQFCPASALQMHPDVWIYCDEDAAAELSLKDYYAWRSSCKENL